jgi:hypothetical protein
MGPRPAHLHLGVAVPSNCPCWAPTRRDPILFAAVTEDGRAIEPAAAQRLRPVANGTASPPLAIQQSLETQQAAIAEVRHSASPPGLTKRWRSSMHGRRDELLIVGDTPALHKGAV